MYFLRTFHPRRFRWLPSCFHPENWSSGEKYFYLVVNSIFFQSICLRLWLAVSQVSEGEFNTPLPPHNLPAAILGGVSFFLAFLVPIFVEWLYDRRVIPWSRSLPTSSIFPLAILLFSTAYLWFVFLFTEYTSIPFQRVLLISAAQTILWAFLLIVVSKFFTDVAKDLSKLPDSIAFLLLMIFVGVAFLGIPYILMNTIPSVEHALRYHHFIWANAGTTLPVLIQSFTPYLSMKREGGQATFKTIHLE